MKLDDVRLAANRAADDLMAALPYASDRQRDLINLMANLLVTYCQSPEIDLGDAIARNYADDAPEAVLSWLG